MSSVRLVDDRFRIEGVFPQIAASELQQLDSVYDTSAAILDRSRDEDQPAWRRELSVRLSGAIRNQRLFEIADVAELLVATFQQLL